MFAHVPNRLDVAATCETLAQLEDDACTSPEQAAAYTRCALFLRSLFEARCVKCGTPLGTASQWAQQLGKAAADERSSSAGCRNIMRDIERRTRGLCSRGCEDGTAQDAG